jgi:hypothetical protein
MNIGWQDDESNPVDTASVFLKFVEFDFVPCVALSLRPPFTHTHTLSSCVKHNSPNAPVAMGSARRSCLAKERRPGSSNTL